MLDYWQQGKVKDYLEGAISDLKTADDYLIEDSDGQKIIKSQIPSLILMINGMIHLVDNEEIKDED